MDWFSLKGVRYIQVVKRAGVKGEIIFYGIIYADDWKIASTVDKIEQMLGSYLPDPNGGAYTKDFDSDKSPSGMLARSGSYQVESRVIDDDEGIYAGLWHKNYRRLDTTKKKFQCQSGNGLSNLPKNGRCYCCAVPSSLVLITYIYVQCPWWICDESHLLAGAYVMNPYRCVIFGCVCSFCKLWNGWPSSFMPELD